MPHSSGGERTHDEPSPPSPASKGEEPPLMKRFFKPVVVLAALLVALTLPIYRAGPQGLAGLSVAERTSRAAGPADSVGKPYDLASLRILNLTLQRIRDNY